MRPLNSPQAKTKSSLTTWTLAPYVLLVLGLLFMFFVSYYLSTLAEAQDQSRFKSSVQEIQQYIFAAGVLFSLSFFGIVRSQVRARAAAERAIADVRDSEATIRKTLAERELAEEALREADQR